MPSSATKFATKAIPIHSLKQGWRTIGTRAIDGTRHNILGMPPINRDESSIKEFSMRYSQFKELWETLMFVMYPDEILFDKLNLSQFDWLETEGFEMQFIYFQSSSIWLQIFIEKGKIWSSFKQKD
ncbi:uncharacterized protein TNCV_5058891 [Trichonephila clavipes]|nr:uncharacterized protein TNCV_5058891 [Trichonephila clavipes]